MKTTIRQDELKKTMDSVKTRVANTAIEEEREKRLASFRASSMSELVALRELKRESGSFLDELTKLDFSGEKRAGANLSELENVPKIVKDLENSISAHEAIASGAVDAATVIDGPPLVTAALLEERIQRVCASVQAIAAR